jgi:hypothetical protein
MTTTLIRSTLTPVRHDDLAPALALRAERELGYSAARIALGTLGPLGNALAKLDIAPFAPESVRAYQDNARSDANARNCREFPGTCSTVEWKRTPLRGYEGVLPLHVLDRALAIHAAANGCVEFFVEEISEDPFLVATTSTEEYYVEVWEEREFERENER